MNHTVLAEIICHIYYDIKNELINKGLSCEFDIFYDNFIENNTDSSFIRELAWVIINSGFKETIARRIFPNLTNCFFNWCPNSICLNSDTCINSSKKFFNNINKLNAITDSARIISTVGKNYLIHKLCLNGPSYLKLFPYIGNVTCYHLAKNLGYQTTKPDRHLIRISNFFNYTNSFDMCYDIHIITGEPLSVIDTVFWRFANLNEKYISKLNILYIKYN